MCYRHLGSSTNASGSVVQDDFHGESSSIISQTQAASEGRMIHLEDITTYIASLVGWDGWDVPYTVIPRCEYLLYIIHHAVMV
jgi:hypothetical protein